MIDYLEANYNSCSCFNNAIGGFTTQQIYDNLETLTLDDDGNRANTIILSVGTNDRNNTSKLTAITVPLEKIIIWCQNYQIDLFILTNTPMLNQTKDGGEHMVQRAIIEACWRKNIPVYDLLSKFNYYLWEHNISLSASTDQTAVLYDNLHPADIGYEIMFNLIKTLLKI